MKFLLLLLVMWVGTLEAKERKLYVGKDSSEAVMTFQHHVELKSRSKPTEDAAREQIGQQLTHLFGPMGESAIRAVPRGDEEVSDVEVLPLDKKGIYDVRYRYRGTIVLQNGPNEEYEVLLPVNPDTIYKAGFPEGSDTNPCTDHHYQSEGDFWYFWNPSNYGCPLQAGRDYEIVKAKIERKANTEKTYPEYARLVNAQGEIVMTVLMGMDDPANGRDPNTSSDINADNFRQIRRTLLSELGFESKKLTKDEIAVITGSASRKPPYVEEFTKKSETAGLVIRVFFGPSGIDQDSSAFHYYLKDALENSSVLMYDGHSGLGGHLDLASIEETEGFKIRPDKKRYQIYYFNSCSSYPYYNTMYFARKKTRADQRGSKNLDIVTNGLATYFSVMHDTNIALIRAIDAWMTTGVRLSYQAFVNEADSGNLLGVNGDEDNPTE